MLVWRWELLGLVMPWFGCGEREKWREMRVCAFS